MPGKGDGVPGGGTAHMDDDRHLPPRRLHGGFGQGLAFLQAEQEALAGAAAHIHAPHPQGLVPPAERAAGGGRNLAGLIVAGVERHDDTPEPLRLKTQLLHTGFLSLFYRALCTA